MRKGIDFNEELRKWFEGMLDAALREGPSSNQKEQFILGRGQSRPRSNCL